MLEADFKCIATYFWFGLVFGDSLTPPKGGTIVRNSSEAEPLIPLGPPCMAAETVIGGWRCALL